LTVDDTPAFQPLARFIHWRPSVYYRDISAEKARKYATYARLWLAPLMGLHKFVTEFFPFIKIIREIPFNIPYFKDETY
jgi:hypothetical protein